MPKVIENIKQTLLEKAKVILLQEGYEALTIRRVAKECNIAVGTVYNYYSSKEIMAGSVMLDDWQNLLAHATGKIEKSLNVKQALLVIYDSIVKFNKIYNVVWEGYVFTGGQQAAFKKRHQLLIKQIASCVHEVFKKFPPKKSDVQSELFLAENILICSGSSQLQFETVMQIALFFLYSEEAQANKSK